MSGLIFKTCLQCYTAGLPKYTHLHSETILVGRLTINHLKLSYSVQTLPTRTLNWQLLLSVKS